MTWIYIKDQHWPSDKEFLCIWKGRIGISYHDSEKNKFWVAMCPAEFDTITEMDDEARDRIKFWMPVPEPIFECDVKKTPTSLVSKSPEASPASL